MNYAYRIYRITITNPLIGGTVYAESMDAAIEKIISQNDILVIHESYPTHTEHYFVNSKMEKVGILVYANAENLKATEVS